MDSGNNERIIYSNPIVTCIYGIPRGSEVSGSDKRRSEAVRVYHCLIFGTIWQILNTVLNTVSLCHDSCMVFSSYLSAFNNFNSLSASVNWTKINYLLPEISQSKKLQLNIPFNFFVFKFLLANPSTLLTHYT